MFFKASNQWPLLPHEELETEEQTKCKTGNQRINKDQAKDSEIELLHQTVTLKLVLR